MNATPPTTIPPAAADAIKTTIASGSYMLALYSIEDGKVLLRRVTHEFPRADFQTSVAMLEQDLNEELKREQSPPTAPVPTGPLPTVQPPAVAIDLFGQGPPPPTPEG